MTNAQRLSENLRKSLKGLQTILETCFLIFYLRPRADLVQEFESMEKATQG